MKISLKRSVARVSGALLVSAHAMLPASMSAAPLELLPLDEVEKRHVLRVLDACHGNRTEAAKILGVDRKTLYRRLLRYGAASE